MKVDELILKRIQKLLNDERTKKYISEVLDISYTSIKRICENYKLQKIDTNPIVEFECIECKNKIVARQRENRKFCNASCNAIYNNKLRKKLEKVKTVKEKKVKEKKYCKNCSNECNKTYCSNECVFQFKRKEKVDTGVANLKTLKRYLIDTHGNKCMECGWCQINTHTGNIPIELEHIDGNNTNNNLNNLKLLCPNCHSLTATYKGANIGKGPIGRMKRYYAGKTY